MTSHFIQQHPPHKELHRVPADLSEFWVVTVLSNPIRYKRRYELYWRFKEMCHHAGVNLITVEQAFGDRQFMVTEPGNPYNLQVRTVEELWHKENMVNLGVKHAQTLAASRGERVREVAWVDADCRPCRTPRDWFEETWHQLQHYEFVQMWEHLLDLDYYHNPIGGPQPSFMANYVKYGTPTPEKFREIERDHRHRHHREHHHRHHHHHCHEYQEKFESYDNGSHIFGRPGLAWAANIDAFNKVGGLIDVAILGAGDWYMAHGLVGTLESAKSEYACGPYMLHMLEWQSRAQRWIKRDVGYVPGTVYHDFHGKKANRFYGSRGKILSECKYDPRTDIKYDSHGMLQLETWDDRQITLRDRIRAHFRARNEDSIDL